MKSRIRLISVISGAAVLLAVVVILIIHAVNTANSQMKPISVEEAVQQYEQAITLLSAAPNAHFAITTEKNTSFDGNEYTLRREQSLTYKNLGTEQMQASLEETMTIGKKKTSITEIFAENTLYYTVNESAFCSEMSPEDFLARFTPVAAIDMDLYRTVTAEKNRDGVFIELTTALSPETWALPQNAKMVTSSGFIHLDSLGKLDKTIYNVEYQTGMANVKLSVTIEPEILSEPEVVNPNKEKYVPITAHDAPRVLEILYSYLLQADNISAMATENINCQASGVKRDQKTTLSLTNASDDLAAIFHTSIDILDYNSGNNATTHTQLETFRDNEYFISNDGGETFQKNSVTAQQMRSYCQDFLVKNLILPQYISSVKLIEQENNCTLQIVATEELAQVICQNVCKILYDDPQLLTNLASSYKTQRITCYYTFDKTTQLPIAAGLDYSGEHIIEGFAYALTYFAEIQYGAAVLVEEPVTEQPAA